MQSSLFIPDHIHTHAGTHLLHFLHSHYSLNWLLQTDSVDDFSCQAGLSGHRHTRAPSLSLSTASLPLSHSTLTFSVGYSFPPLSPLSYIFIHPDGDLFSLKLLPNFSLTQTLILSTWGKLIWSLQRTVTDGHALMDERCSCKGHCYECTGQLGCSLDLSSRQWP